MKHDIYKTAYLPNIAAETVVFDEIRKRLGDNWHQLPGIQEWRLYGCAAFRTTGS